MVDWAYEHLPPFADGSGPSAMECGCGESLRRIPLSNPSRRASPAGNGTLLLSILYPSKPKYRRTLPRHSPRHFTGIDYSDLSIELSSKVEGLRRRRWEKRIRSDQRRQEAGEELGGSDSESDDDDDDDDDDDEDEDEDTVNDSPAVTWFASDLLTSTLDDLHQQSANVPLDGWDLVLDKGTYDAIALSQEPVDSGPSKGKLPSLVYPERVVELVKIGGFFLITCGCRNG